MKTFLSKFKKPATKSGEGAILVIAGLAFLASQKSNSARRGKG